MLNNNMKVHPRGFYGSGLAGVMSRVTPPDNLVTRPLEAVQVENFVANKSIEDLFHEYTSGHVKISDFEACKKILVDVTKAFGHKDFEVWHSQQYDSPFFGQLHVDFIEDWCKYLCTGSRDIDLYTWAAMLDRSDQQADKKAPLGKYTSMYFNKKNIFPFSGERPTVLRMLANMLTHQNGFDSVVLTAHILFCIKY